MGLWLKEWFDYSGNGFKLSWLWNSIVDGIYLTGPRFGGSAEWPLLARGFGQYNKVGYTIDTVVRFMVMKK